MKLSLNHVTEALANVRELQRAVLERQRFHGFSGRARMTSGTLALTAAAVMSMDVFPRTNLAHVLGWGAVFVMAFFMNAVALACWFASDHGGRREMRSIRPVLDVIPPIVVGGLLTAVMILNRKYEFLFGIWMCLFGLTNMATRMVLPKLIWGVGVFYLAAGATCLLAPHMDFTNPWPMGIAFFAGEWVGGLVLHYDGSRYVPERVPAGEIEDTTHEA